MRSRPSGLAAAALALLLVSQPLRAQEKGPAPLSNADIQTSIDSLGSLDFPIRMNAARALRRAPADAVSPALVKAVESHKDQFVRFRALVLLTALNDSGTAELMRQMAANPNDRLRTVAYMYFEHHPAAAIVPTLLNAVEREESEFVRPALVRALAAHGNDPKVRATLLVEVERGQDYFRSAVIEGLGDYQATYALEPLMRIAQQAGPLQVDAVIALGKLKDPRAMEVLATLQRSAPREIQPTIATAICLLGTNCDVHLPYVVETLRFAEKNAGFQEILRNAVAGLVALASSGQQAALSGLVEVGVVAGDAARAPVALGLGAIAIRNTSLVLGFLEKYPARAGAIDLIAEGFDRLEEDYEEERFFAAVRQEYWKAPEGSPTRVVSEALIQQLEF